MAQIKSRLTLLFLTLTVALLLVAAAAAEIVSDDWVLVDHADSIRQASCPDPSEKKAFEPLSLSVQTVPTGPADLPDGVSIHGAWVLQSDDPAFGGLSGLTQLDDGDLLAVSDMGTFIRIGMRGGGPTGAASKARMRFENRLMRPNKLTADAEGLDYQDGIALVSFERQFRVLAFDLDGCAMAARGVRVGTPATHYGGRRIRANAGPEALMLAPGGQMTLGYEQPRTERAVTAQLLSDGSVRLSGPTDGMPLEPGFRLVGMDHLTLSDGGEVTSHLSRAYDRDRGNRSILAVTTHGDMAMPSAGPDIRLQPPMLVDNFEGIVLTEIDQGIRAYIIADDNFSDRQQTLLYALDLAR